MSRLAVTFVQDIKGKWHTLALPDTDPADQLELIKSVRHTGYAKIAGKLTQVRKGYTLTTTGPLRRFDRIVLPSCVAAPEAQPPVQLPNLPQPTLVEPAAPVPPLIPEEDDNG